MSSKAVLLLAAALLGAPAPATAKDTVAVLSAESGAYLEAFSAFQAEYGAEVRHFDASRGKVALPAGTRTVVTFGAKAMAQEYPPSLNIVSALAPGYFLPQQGRTGRLVKVSMIPDFQRLFAVLKSVQPQLKRLQVFWMTESLGNFKGPIAAAGAAAGVEVSAVKVTDLERLPALLREGRGEMDAFFLPPDPFLISSESLMIFREFSWSNGIPMYASTKGMAREGATASVGISFSESGAAAARAARALQAGQEPPAILFPEKAELTLNATAAKKCGLQLPPELVREAAFLYP